MQSYHRRLSRSPVANQKNYRNKSKSPVKANQFTNCESNLHLALQLAEKHRMETHTLRQKYEALEKQNLNKQCLINQLSAKVKQLEGVNEKNIGKYRKLKEKYKNLKKVEKSQVVLPINKQNKEQNITEFPLKNSAFKLETNPQQQSGKKQNQENSQINHFKGELAHKERVIRHLSNQINICEDNTMNVIRLVDVLEQRIQQLGMENNLLRGMIREREKSYETSGDIGYGRGSGVIFSQGD